MGGGKDAPAAPDYEAAAREQAQSSREVTEQQTWANRPTQNTPWGTLSWESEKAYDPATQQYLNKWTQNIDLTPEQQAALDSQMRIQEGRSGLAESLLGRAGKEFGDTMDWSKFQPFGMGPQANDYNPQRLQRNIDTSNLQDVDSSNRYYDEAGNAILGQFEQRMEPRFEQQTAELETQLRNQGLQPGDRAYDYAMTQERQKQDDARLMASREATLMSGAEAERMYGMDLGLRGQQFGEAIGTGDFANRATTDTLRNAMAAGGQSFGEDLTSSNYQTSLRQQQIAEEMQRRGFSLNEINAILTGQQVGMPSMPSFNTAQRSEGVQALNAAQMTGQSNLDTFNAQQAGTNALMQGAGSAAGAAMMFSDRRLKTDIIPLGNGWYVYKLFGHIPSVGVMADEAPPDAIALHPSGFLMVDYGKL